MHGFLDLGSEQAPSTRGCRCTALVLRSRLEGLRCDDPFCRNSLIGAESTNVEIMPGVVTLQYGLQNVGWSAMFAAYYMQGSGYGTTLLDR
jgi:hypothetical protein